MTIAQYYNEAKRRMEVPIIVSGGADTDNYISYCSMENTDVATTFAGLPPQNFDKVLRWIPGTGYAMAQYYGGTWYDADLVNPIEAGVGYIYAIKAAGGSTTWYYECVFSPSASRSQLCRPIGTKGVLQQ